MLLYAEIQLLRFLGYSGKSGGKSSDLLGADDDEYQRGHADEHYKPLHEVRLERGDIAAENYQHG